MTLAPDHQNPERSDESLLHGRPGRFGRESETRRVLASASRSDRPIQNPKPRIQIPLLAVFALLAGCAPAPGPIFPAVSPPIVWPAPPDPPRVRWIGELRGEASLGLQPRGWEAVRAVLAGPRPQVAFSRPSAVAVAGECVFVADTGLGVVHRLDLVSRRYATITGPPPERLRVPIDLALTPAGTLLVADRGRAAIDTYDLEGNWRSTTRGDWLRGPAGLAWDAPAGVCWIADAVEHACLAWRPGDAAPSRRLGGRGSGIGELNFPTALAWHPAVGLVVADAMNFRVQVFDVAVAAADTTAAAPIRAFGQKGDAAGDFARPRGVAVDSDGHVYVVDNQFENVQVFDAAGQLLLAFGESGAGPGQFALPAGITIDPQDRIWIADSLNRRVQVFAYMRSS